MTILLGVSGIYEDEEVSDGTDGGGGGSVRGFSSLACCRRVSSPFSFTAFYGRFIFLPIVLQFITETHLDTFSITLPYLPTFLLKFIRLLL
jgi:hypothetical protein